MSNDSKPQSVSEELDEDGIAAATRVRFLLESTHEKKIEEEVTEQRKVFTELFELQNSCEHIVWDQVARWIRFEESVEESGARWSKPHLSTLQLQAVSFLKVYLKKGVLKLDVDASSFTSAISIISNELDSLGVFEDDQKFQFEQTLNGNRIHQFNIQKAEKAKYNPKQSFRKMSRRLSAKGDRRKNISNVEDIGTELETTNSFANDMAVNELENEKINSILLRKIPKNSEAFAVFEGEVPWLDKPIAALVRIQNAESFDDVVEVPIPVRFIFVHLGPQSDDPTRPSYKEVGRAISTLMSDETFLEVAYCATDVGHIVDGIDEFLTRVIVLPPGEWDASIRIEPPQRTPGFGAGQIKKAGTEDEDEEPGAGHTDPTLVFTKRPFGGLINDIRRKAPWYLSDITDSFSLQSIASFFYMFFAIVPNCVTFGGFMDIATHGHIGAIENLLGNAIAGVIFTLFSGQPMNVLGPTGPMLIFETIVYTMCSDLGLDYMSFRFWVGIWSAVLMMIVVMTDASCLVKYITRFTEESFAFLIAIVFIYQSFQKLDHVAQAHHRTLLVPNYDHVTNMTCSCRLIPNYTTDSVDYHSYDHWHAILLKNDMGEVADQPWLVFDRTNLSKSVEIIDHIEWHKVPLNHCAAVHGELIGDACYEVQDILLMSIVLMLGTYTMINFLRSMRAARFFPSTVRKLIADFAIVITIVLFCAVDFGVGLDTPKLLVPHQFEPTKPEVRGWIIHPFNGNPGWSCILALAPAILATILMFMDQQITAVIVNRKENKLKKGSGYHLDLFILAITVVISSILGLPWQVAATVLAITNINSLRMESETKAPGELPEAIGCREQRVTLTLAFILLGCAVFMGPLLKLIPMPVLYGIFLYMGVAALSGLQLMERLALFFMPVKHQPDFTYLRAVKLTRVHLFTIIQMLCFAALMVIKLIKKTSILFPLMLLVMILVRKLMEFIFTQNELEHLDDFMPQFRRKKHVAVQRKETADELVIPLSVVEDADNLRITLPNGNVILIPRQHRHQSESRSENGDNATRRRMISKGSNNEATYPLLE